MGRRVGFSTENQGVQKLTGGLAGITFIQEFNTLRKVRHQNQNRSTETKRFWNKCLTFGTPGNSRARAQGVPVHTSTNNRGLAGFYPGLHTVFPRNL